MPKLDVLNKALNEGLFIRSSDSVCVMLKEKDPNASLKCVNVTNLPSGSVIFSLNKVRIGKLYKGSGPARRCDFIILTELEGKNLAIFIELKSGRISENDYIEQFKGAECLIDYIDSVLLRFHDGKVLDKYEKRFVLFYKCPIYKMPTITKAILNDDPQKTLIYANPDEVPVEWLCGGVI